MSQARQTLIWTSRAHEENDSESLDVTHCHYSLAFSHERAMKQGLDTIKSGIHKECRFFKIGQRCAEVKSPGQLISVAHISDRHS